MHVLVIGSGGREHALVDAIDRSPLTSRISVAPGNPGMISMAERPDLKADDPEAIISFARAEAVDLVVIGPEAPLVAGLADTLNTAGIPTFGPSAEAAKLEGSKAFSREFCARHNIPQPRFARFTDSAAALAHLQETCPDQGVVIKADGLAAGKGVVVADTLKEAEDAVRMMLDDAGFGDAGSAILIEERIAGTEASLFALVDGHDAVFLGSAQDYKRAYDGDKGPNTGGMGAISPAPRLTPALQQEAWEKIVLPVVRGMEAEGRPYRGFLYAGLMLTDKGPQVIEFNCRFGDPEAEVILPRLKSDLLSAMLTAMEAGLRHADLRFEDKVAVTVIMANGGYPGHTDKGAVIHGLEAEMANTMVFHAGTDRDEEGQIIATGGRVLAVTGLGGDAAEARQNAYDRLGQITWDRVMYRRDIAAG
ncbi:phosphoribosylamine--glycine ligase [Alphaproteobacteria bacterium LSUCC0684]